MPTAEDPRTTIRWAPVEYMALRAMAAGGDARGVGTVVRLLVREGLERRGVFASPPTPHLAEDFEVPSGEVPTVPAGLSPAASRPAAAAPPLQKLMVAVARLAMEHRGPATPIELAAAKRRIGRGLVTVAGVVVKDPHRLVDPSTVEVAGV